MKQTRLMKVGPIWAGGALAVGVVAVWAQGPGAGRTARALFDAMDANHDGTLTQVEMQSAFDSWFTTWSGGSGTLTRDQIEAGLRKVLPAPPAAKPGQANTFNVAGNSTPIPVSQAGVDAMMAALPARQVLNRCVLAKCWCLRIRDPEASCMPRYLSLPRPWKL